MLSPEKEREKKAAAAKRRRQQKHASMSQDEREAERARKAAAAKRRRQQKRAASIEESTGERQWHVDMLLPTGNKYNIIILYHFSISGASCDVLLFAFAKK